jgi:cobalt/nickel transport system permease protein
MIGVPFAVHISDGVLTWPWLGGGFVLAGVLVAGAMVRVRDEEIPRIALTTAAFFVASLIHVPIGPTSVHLLLNGLLGVIVGRRAPLAVLLGLTLQAVLFGHGGFTTIGVNTCVMALPALGAAWLFGALRTGSHNVLFRAGLVVVSVLVWMLCLIYSIALLWLSRSTGLNDIAWGSAAVVAFQPAVLLIAAILVTTAAWMECRLGHAAEFPVGLLVGMTGVLATLVLNAAVLLWGGAEDWHSIVLLVFVVHMPIAVAEGVILGFAVGFLARVKPEMLGGLSDEAEAVKRWEISPAPTNTVTTRSAPAGGTLAPPALLFAVASVLWAAAPAQAHRLDADYRVRPDGKVQVESWFDVDDKAPAGAKVQVFRPDGALLSEGSLDERGVFVFSPGEAGNLKVVVYAGAGHRAEFTIPKEILARESKNSSGQEKTSGPSRLNINYAPLVERAQLSHCGEVMTGLAFLLGLAAFVMSWRNMRHLRELKRLQEEAARLTDNDDHFAAGKTSSSGTSH